MDSSWEILHGTVLGLVPSLGLGMVLAERVLGESDRLARLAVAIALALFSTLLGVNGFYHLVPLSQAVGYTVVLQLVVWLTVLFLFRLPATKSPPENSHSDIADIADSAASTGVHTGHCADNTTSSVLLRVLWPFLLVIYLFTSSQQLLNPDDDYWIHSPLQGLMLHDNFPPFNPFFSDIPMNGHYGRNLSIVATAWLSGLDTFYLQHLLTNIVQMVTFVLCFLAIWTWSRSRPQALGGAFLIFFGINVGGRGGLMDTLQNNNAYVHLYFALVFYLFCKALCRQSLLTEVLLGLVLGGYAIVYETHFGLSCLALCGCLPLLWWHSQKEAALFTRHNLFRLVLVVVALAVPLAATQGGPITNLFQRRLAGEAEVRPDQLSKGMQNQSQVVKITFPKKDLFQILLENGEYQRICCIYYSDSIFKYLYTPSPGRGYRYIFSWDVLKLHFLPLYLSLWSGYYLWKRRHIAGWWLWSWGMVSFLIPALVDFGPIYESEYFRWEFSSGLGFAGALGICLGDWWQKTAQEPLDWTYDINSQGLKVQIFGPGWIKLLIVFIFYCDTLGCQQFVAKRILDLPRWGGLWAGALRLPSTEEWLQNHTVLDFTPADWRAARWLESQVQSGQRLLTNFKQENNFSILFESTLTGVCGARCVGHALPLDDEAIGTTPYHMSAPAAAFWEPLRRAGGAGHKILCNPLYLDQLQVDWIYFRPEHPGQSLEAGPNLELVRLEVHGANQRQIYRYHRSQTPAGPTSVAFDKEALTAKMTAKMTASVGVQPAARGGFACPVYMAVNRTQLEKLPADSVIKLRPARLSQSPGDEKVPSEVELLSVPVRLLLQQDPPNLNICYCWDWTAPMEEGRYRIDLSLSSKSQAKGGEGVNPSDEMKIAPSADSKVLVEVSFSSSLQACRTYRATGIDPFAHSHSLEMLRAESQTLQVPPGQLVEGDFELSLPAQPHRFLGTDLSVRACLAPIVLTSDQGLGDVSQEKVEKIHRGEAHGDAYWLPGIDVQDIRLVPTRSGSELTLECRVSGKAPEHVGRYRFDLFLSPEHGKLYRYPGFEVEVRAR